VGEQIENHRFSEACPALSILFKNKKGEGL